MASRRHGPMTVRKKVKLSQWAAAMGIPSRTAQRQAQQGTLEANVVATDTGRYFVLVTPTEAFLLNELVTLRSKMAA